MAKKNFNWGNIYKKGMKKKERANKLEKANEGNSRVQKHKAIVQDKKPLKVNTKPESTTVDKASVKVDTKPKSNVVKYTPPKNFEWDSGLNIIDNPKIVIDHNLLMICDKIQEEFKGEEFSILVKGNYTDYGFYVSADYIIPKQKVSTSSVIYDDDDPLNGYQKDGYNVVIHSHHSMGTFFSNTDKEYINCQFPVSVLYVHAGFTLATLSFQKGDNIFIMETKNIKTVLENNHTVEGFENISKGVTTYYNNNNYDYTDQSNKKSLWNKKEEDEDDDPFLSNKKKTYADTDEDQDVEIEDATLIMQYLEDGEHVIVNGVKMTIENYEICEKCGLDNPEVCRECLQSFKDESEEAEKAEEVLTD